MKIPLNWLKDYVKTDASPREIAASFTQLGLMLDKPLDDSSVLDLEHRMDRSDWLSIIGCARDYAAFNKLKLNYPKSNAKKLPLVSPSEMVEITVNTPVVRRFNTRLVKNVRVGESPDWLKERLTAYGIKSINNVVDITNYVMVELGQPMHAQDLAKLKKREITLRPAKAGETVKTILGTTVTLDKDIFVLSSGGVATVIGGIVGGIETSVTNNTTDIILDAGNYDQSVIRKNSRKLKIINETVSRYDKFLHPDLCEIALDRATYLLESITGATVFVNHDYYPVPPAPVVQKLTFARLKILSGMDLPISVVKRILTALEYQILSSTKDGLTLKVPYFRTDVEVEDDVVADILRINDYSSIPTSPLDTPVPKDITPAILTFEERLRDLLVSFGAHEHITASLVKESDDNGEILLSNALSADQNALRTSAIPKLMGVRSNYQKHQVGVPIIFEIGKSFKQLNGKYQEIRELAIVGHNVERSLATLMHQLGIKYLVTNAGEIIISNTTIGRLEFGAANLDTTLLLQYQHKYAGIISDFTHVIKRDISLITPKSITYFDISSVIEATHPNFNYSCKSIDRIGKDINYVLTLTWLHDEKSIDVELSEVIAKVTKKLGIKSKT